MASGSGRTCEDSSTKEEGLELLDDLKPRLLLLERAAIVPKLAKEKDHNCMIGLRTSAKSTTAPSPEHIYCECRDQGRGEGCCIPDFFGDE